MKHDLVITGGTLITAEKTFSADIGIQAGLIREIGSGLNGAQRTGTAAAACGGTTTVIDFIEPEPGQTLLQALTRRRAEADGQAVTDYSLHMTITTAMIDNLDEVNEVLAAGITSFKLYTTYDGMILNDYQLLEAMKAVAQSGGMVLVHCENDAITRFWTNDLLQKGCRGPDSHPLSRPAPAEEEAVNRVLSLAGSAGAAVYIVHISTAGGAEAVARARENGQTAWGETCPQYLLLNEDLYSSKSKPNSDKKGAQKTEPLEDEPEPANFEGAKYVCAPPLRSQRHQQALWQHLSKGSLHTIGTDHCPFNFTGQKDLGRNDFTRIPGGLPGIQSRLALMYTYGVLQGLISPNEWVQLCSTGPAMIFGLYPRKGSLEAGADADIVLFDPQARTTITRESLSENVDYTPYEGFELTGLPVQVLLKGKLAARNGQFVESTPAGSFLRRKR
jgi:dihydropyrimidinase